jgi:hypothetical protein
MFGDIPGLRRISLIEMLADCVAAQPSDGSRLQMMLTVAGLPDKPLLDPKHQG